MYLLKAPDLLNTLTMSMLGFYMYSKTAFCVSKMVVVLS